MATTEGWDQYKLLVLEKLDGLHAVAREHEDRDNERFAKISEDIAALRIDVAGLKVQAGIWGLLGGAIPVVIALVLLYIERK